MKNFINQIKNKVLEGSNIDYKEALKLISIDNGDIDNLKLLLDGADQIREKYNGDKVDMCSIMNAKSGKCSEDCKFCAQSGHYTTGINEYSLINYDEAYQRVSEMEQKGVDRFSLVTSGKGVTDEEFSNLLDIYGKLNENTNISLCASHGVISYEQAKKLKDTGINMYHHNIETSKNYYNEICTTHSYEERVGTIRNIKSAGMEVCCGVIIGMGESIEDRLNMMFEIRDLEVDSIPVNVLNPIKGTPLENLEILEPMEILKTIAVYRYIVPKSHIRYAGGRNALRDKQNVGLRGGANALLVGDYLTTIGSNIDDDKKMILGEGLIY
ncbi:biotin synthase BioB [Gottschalkia acidurici 9a]|uniref:Biotin synthase n=1 Tax=Gottschalkia acidurici (strain ATCC 7906 / DSM 604 / BCRC 14475 / CIP 104303 / KCTC 5404 / NCIMB 10678 / 9a) TaxID=1128398 RepID=K0AWM1_GOTA9|nr:biotin synthase BioB [Gottschalkia acidurici]AFS77167.1 biotin synthase BioB [Gottschalkia acidurici 9a]